VIFTPLIQPFTAGSTIFEYPSRRVVVRNALLVPRNISVPYTSRRAADGFVVPIPTFPDTIKLSAGAAVLEYAAPILALLAIIEVFEFIANV
jgi:hypothetical protein